MRRGARSWKLGILGILPGMLVPPAADAESTRPQHRDWIRKFEAGGGSFDAATAHAVSPLVSNDTRGQHLRWSQRLRPGTAALPTLEIGDGAASEPLRKLRRDRPAARD